MPTATVPITLDTATFHASVVLAEEAMGELHAESPELAHEFIEHLLRIPELLSQMASIKNGPTGASISLVLEPTDFLLQLPAAIRARNLDFLIVE